MANPEHTDRGLGLETLQAGRNAEAYALLRPFAEAGDAEVQAHLGGMMVFGWFLIASTEEQGSYARELGADVDQALRWLQNASDQGIGPASHNLAMAYVMGCGGTSPERRLAKAKELLARASEQGFAFFGGEEGADGYLQTLEGYAKGQGISVPWEDRRDAEPDAPADGGGM